MVDRLTVPVQRVGCQRPGKLLRTEYINCAYKVYTVGQVCTGYTYACGAGHSERTHGAGTDMGHGQKPQAHSTCWELMCVWGGGPGC